MEEIRQSWSKLIHYMDTALPQKKKPITGSFGSHQGAHLGTIQNHQLFESSCHQKSDMVPGAATTTTTSTAIQSPVQVVQHSPSIFSSNGPYFSSWGLTASVNYQVGILDSSDIFVCRPTSDLHSPATAPTLTALTASVYDIKHSVYPRRKQKMALFAVVKIQISYVFTSGHTLMSSDN
ncbi:hypothetical protein MKW98_012767 [Papaver atlanticum]|uniref:Uncharacterized protein n=1 Tax=Papaver atlanticum TaxID=357466 RepID=A0AAD4SUS6_9MAGN|nr:hypothetical protein MKW98_012767 [Papaver atlanticum]